MKKKLCVEMMGRGYAWRDIGTSEGLLEAGEFISTIENRQSLKLVGDFLDTSHPSEILAWLL